MAVSYLVDWKNGFVGGFDKDLNQKFNVTEQELLGAMEHYGVENLKIITQSELDELHDYHKPTFEEYIGGGVRHGTQNDKNDKEEQ